jgi:hypothetical protein
MVIAMWFIKNVDLTEDKGAEEDERRASHESQVTEKVVGNGPEKV